MYRISVLVSGDGAALDNLACHCFESEEGMLVGFVEIVQVVANRECEALQVASKWNIPTVVFKEEDYPNKTAWSEAVLGAEVDLHVMANFDGQLVIGEQRQNKVVNVHSSLLPAHADKRGMAIHEAVIAAEEEYTGCSVHTVTSDPTEGWIIGQIKIAVLPWDNPWSIQRSVADMEKKLYPRTILNYLRKPLNISSS